MKQKSKYENLWNINYHKDTLIFHSSLWEKIAEENINIEVRYYSTVLRPAISYRYPFKEIKLNGTKKIYIEKVSRR